MLSYGEEALSMSHMGAFEMPRKKRKKMEKGRNILY
jgi:hypothetical protein